MQIAASASVIDSDKLRIAAQELLIVSLLLTPTYCFAQEAQHLGTPQERKACSRDASRFCRQVLGDDMAVSQCLQQHRAKLIRSCQQVFQNHGM
jgi:hypothetical protein